MSEWRSKGWHYSVDDGSRFAENRGQPTVIYRFAAYPGPYFGGICGEAPQFSFSDDVVPDWTPYYAADELKFTVSTVGWRREFELMQLAHGGSLQLIPKDYRDVGEYEKIGHALAKANSPISLAIGTRQFATVPPSPLIGRFVEQCLRWSKQERLQKSAAIHVNGR